MAVEGAGSGGLARQGLWALVDQVLSSGTNFVPALLLARVLGPAGFGTFSLAFLAWFGALGVLRSAVMQPYTLAASHLEGEAWRDATRHAGGAVVFGGVGWSVVFGAASAVTFLVGSPSGLASALLVVAILAPGLALQEFWRIASFSKRRAKTAAANDGIWAMGQVVTFTLLLTVGTPTASSSLWAWGLGAWLAAAVGTRQLGVTPRVDAAALRFARQWARIGAWFTGVTALFALGLVGVALIITATAGSAGLGLFRTVQNLFGPVQLLTIGAESVFLPHLVRMMKRTGTSGLRESTLYSLVMTGAIAGYGVVLLITALPILVNVFGPAFAPADVLVLPTMIAFTLDAAAMGAVAQLRARAAGSRLFIGQAAATLTRVASVAALAAFGGLNDAVWGLVIGSTIGAAVMWAQVAALTHRQPPLDAPATPNRAA